VIVRCRAGGLDKRQKASEGGQHLGKVKRRVNGRGILEG
jgi:hypothetical protein